MPNIITNSGIAFGPNPNVKVMQDSSLGSGIRTMDAAGIATGMAFLEGELEKRDPKVREPLTSVTWPRDIVAETGGGWVDFTSTMDWPEPWKSHRWHRQQVRSHHCRKSHNRHPWCW